MSHTTSPHLQDCPDSSSQLLTVEVRGLQASAPLPQRRNTHENILQSIFLVNRSEPVLHQLDQPDENLSRFNMVEIFTSLHCQIPPPPPISSNFKCQCRPPRLVWSASPSGYDLSRYPPVTWWGEHFFFTKCPLRNTLVNIYFRYLHLFAMSVYSVKQVILTITDLCWTMIITMLH